MRWIVILKVGIGSLLPLHFNLEPVRRCTLTRLFSNF
jgi:hypothetical protein